MLKKETFIPALLKQVANTQDVDSLTDELLANVGKEVGADRTYIFELNENSGNWDNTHEWCNDGIEPQIGNLQDVAAEIIDVWLREFKRSNRVIIYDLEVYRSESRAMYDILKPQDIHSLVVCPLEIHGKYVGFFGVDNPPKKGIEAISGILSELQHILAIMLRYRSLTQELSRMSFEDQLTGAKNRHALMRDGSKLGAKGNIGFVMCDINGLKTANDTQGHEAGDTLIRNTAEALFEVFGKQHVYRLGGDEFAVYKHYANEPEFLASLERMKSAFQARGVRVAMGYVFSPEANVEVRESGKGGDRRKNRR